ncbi:MAG: hypothetical protein U0491_02395 [Candidatus Saccharimonadales bacterium]
MKRYVLLVATLVLAVAGGLVFWGSTFAKNMVHDQLVEQKITFPSAEQLKAEGDSDLAKYGGQAVDTGAEAYAYSQYIKGHLQKVANGQTYSEVSAAFLKDKTNQTLATQRQTLFMGETLRGLLLSAYGWGLMGVIAFWSALGLLAAAAASLVAYLYVVSLPAKKPAKKVKKSKK